MSVAVQQLPTSTCVCSTVYFEVCDLLDRNDPQILENSFFVCRFFVPVHWQSSFNDNRFGGEGKGEGVKSGQVRGGKGSPAM